MCEPSVRVSEAEATNDFPSLLARVRAGAEVVIERDAEAVAVIRRAAPDLRLLSESLRLAEERGSNATLDGEFGRDLEAVVGSHHEPLTRLRGLDSRLECRAIAAERRGDTVQDFFSASLIPR